MKLLVISGGKHPYAETTPILEEFLRNAGHEVLASNDAAVLADGAAMDRYDALVFNTRRENLPDFGDLALNAAEQQGLKDFIASGRRFVCLHIGTCRPDDRLEFHAITGGGWITGTSFHPPYGSFTVNVSAPDHVCARGIADFAIEDELYMGLAVDRDNDVFLTADGDAGTHPWGPERAPMDMPAGTFPLGWTRTFGDGKVYVLPLGHDARSFQSPEFQQLVLNGVDWATAA